MKIKHENLGFVEGGLSSAINLLLFFLKLWAGITSQSVAMIADAWHTLSDTLTSLVVIFGFWIARKPADEKHPFGHGRAEVIAAVVISTLLALAGFKFFWDSIGQLRHQQAVIFTRLAILIFLISVILKEALARFSFWAGKKIKSQSLLADGWHHRSDAIASGLIVVGGIFGEYFWWMDGVLGIVVSFFILKAAYDIFKETSDTLLGENTDQFLEKEIIKIIFKMTGQSLDIHHIHVHRYGTHQEVTFHVCFPGETTLEQAHTKVDQIEQELRKKLNVEATIHIDPMVDD
ncbi:cation transporter [candidate division KSB1 bacterium]|nr:cation transporter [candidate division KSB1 bacterium]